MICGRINRHFSYLVHLFVKAVVANTAVCLGYSFMTLDIVVHTRSLLLEHATARENSVSLLYGFGKYLL